MEQIVTRRRFLLAAATLPLLVRGTAWAASGRDGATARLAALEATFPGRLGVFARDTATGRRVRYRAGERFPLCSTFKVVLAGAILARSGGQADLLDRRVRYARADLVSYSPVTEQHLDDGLTVTTFAPGDKIDVPDWVGEMAINHYGAVEVKITKKPKE